jgi:hypothetical protein
MTTFFPVWCRRCGEEKDAVRHEDGDVEWLCGCPDHEKRIASMFSRACGRKALLSLPFKPDCNLRFSVGTPSVLLDILTSSVHLTPRYFIEQMKAAGIGYERKIGRAVYTETHVNTVVAFANTLAERSRANHVAKSSNRNLVIWRCP